ncbi:MAG: hypothetical protein NVSMB64_14060 [Candidatus Velthaea sp.]
MIVVSTPKHLECVCPDCEIPNAVFKVSYLWGDQILLDAVCAKCSRFYWRRWDLLRLQLEKDEREIERITKNGTSGD